MIVVTGATGSIGKELVKLLVTTKTPARAIARDPSKLAGLGIHAVAADLSDPSSLDKAFEGANHLFLLTSAGPDQVKLQHNAIEAAKRAGFHHVVKLSVIGAHLSSPVQLGKWHAESEAELKESGMGWTMLQPHSFCQNFFGNIPTIHKEGTIYGAAGQGKVPFIDIRDIAAVSLMALTAPGHMGRSYTLSGGEAYTHAQAAEILGKAIGKPLRYVDIPAEAFQKALIDVGMPAWLAKDLATLHQYFASNAAAEISPAVQEITRNPARTFEDFARDFAAAFK